jgi:TolB-like protein/DNA-binding winged helix-turn-helix (wHTH) protein/Flp pilus assembly protein TadD
MPENESMDGPGSANVVLFEAFRLDLPGGGLFRLDHAGTTTPVSISSRALDLLGLLVARQGQLVSKDAIMEAVWPGTIVEEGNLTVQISALRRILDENRNEGSCIQTVPGRGYRFIAPVTRGEPAAPPQSTPSPRNGRGHPVVDNTKLEDPVPLGQIGSTLEPMRRAEHRRRGRVVAAVIGALCLISVVVVGTARWHGPWFKAVHPMPRLSIAVLPFTNLSDDREQRYLADGITEDLTTDLSRIAPMFVISHRTAFGYRDNRADIQQIGHELSVRYFVEGSVRRSGDEVLVDAKLIDAESGSLLWAERFKRDAGDFFTLQDEITSRIAVALNLELLTAAATRSVEHPDALDYILRGRAVYLRVSPRDGHAEAISLFERALALDPRSLEAQSRLAMALTARLLDEVTESAEADIRRAQELIGQALTNSPHDPLAHYAKGLLLRAQHRCGDAVPEYEAAIAFNRNWASAYADLGWCKFLVGSIEQAMPLMERAADLSPRDPQIGNWDSRIGLTYLVQSRLNDAVLWLEKARGAAPELPWVHLRLAAAYGLQGEIERAAAEIAEAQRMDGQGPDLTIAHLKVPGFSSGTKTSALFDTTYFAGLRKAGMPEE